VRVKKEVRELCVQFVKACRNGNIEEANRLERVLVGEWKFTPFNLLALFCNPRTIEYNDENMWLVLEASEK